MSALCQISEILGGYSRRLENELIDLANVCASARVFGHEGVMRRSGLLTAVFALAVGIAVAFGSSPGAAQPQPRAHVYLLRGLLKIFSLGMDSLAEETEGA